MNQQIQQLADEAEKYADANFKGEPFWSEAYESKFAELMVQDCIRTLRSNGYDDAAKCLQDVYFGIENPV